MADDNIETILIKPTPLEIGTNCLICDRFISLGYGYYGNYASMVKICDECKKRLVKILYEDVAEGER